MLAAVLTLVWQQVPSARELNRMLARVRGIAFNLIAYLTAPEHLRVNAIAFTLEFN
jgi:hypothetical protein